MLHILSCPSSFLQTPVPWRKSRNVGTSIFSCKNSAEFINPQCQNSRKKFPGGGTRVDRRAARLPSPKCPTHFLSLTEIPRRRFSGPVGKSPCPNSFLHMGSIALHYRLLFVTFSPFILKPPSPLPKLVGQRCTLQDWHLLRRRQLHLSSFS